MIVGDDNNKSSVFIVSSGNISSIREELEDVRDLNYDIKVDTIMNKFVESCKETIRQGSEIVYFSLNVSEENKTYISKDVINEFCRRLNDEKFDYKYVELLEGKSIVFEVNLNLK